jgi:hypothetical protein
MEIDAPDAVSLASNEPVTVHVNFFNGSERSRLEMRIEGGPWQTMEHVRAVDPKLQRTFEREAALLDLKKDAWRALSKPKPSTHLWKGVLNLPLPEGSPAIEIRATDHWGRVYEDRRIIRVTP